MPTEPPPSSWTFPPLDGAEPEGPVALGGDLEPGTLLAAYRGGLFPMPVGANDTLGWWSPDPRGVIPVTEMHVSRTLRRSMQRMEFSEDTHFSQVVAECANPERPHGWISAEIAEAYERLHKLGWAHSVEVWVDGDLAGGLYGLSIGNFFAGESMFHRSTDASKAAVAYLAEKMNGLPNALFDVQWLTPHLETLGAIEISREDYVQQLNASTAHTTSQRW